MLDQTTLPPEPLPKRVIREDHALGSVQLAIELVLGGIAITAIAICLIGMGELRAMRSCTQAINSSLNTGSP